MLCLFASRASDLGSDKKTLTLLIQWLFRNIDLDPKQGFVVRFVSSFESGFQKKLRLLEREEVITSEAKRIMRDPSPMKYFDILKWILDVFPEPGSPINELEDDTYFLFLTLFGSRCLNLVMYFYLISFKFLS